ncbi:MAG: TonB-dependent receptor plug domain-containing protein [Sphingomonas sp.]|nr:TonB-dependent receptor plug domain-containing protein [Sphingomonas sp.]
MDDTGDEEEIVITGAKPRGSVVGDIPPENTLDARDVRATGATSINELLDALAPQIGSARGRGGEQPVLLLNGQRISGFRELRDIPTEAIQRVEILPEEVALKYGYRADQKVVNFVLRNRFRSTTAQVGAGLATDGGYVNGNADLTRFLVQRNGRTTYNLHAEGNGMLTENERDILLETPPTIGTTEQTLAARSLVGTNRDIRGSATLNRNILGNVSATLNGELEHQEGRSLIGLNQTLLDPLARNTNTDTAHLGTTLNGQTKSQWKWTLTGNADLARTVTHTDRDNATFPEDRARTTTASGDLTATANGNIFKLPAGNASTTLTAGLAAQHLDVSRTQAGIRTPGSLSRTTGNAAINVDVPISRRGREFSALGNLTLNANAEVDQLSDFGTLTTIGAGANFSPVERLSFITSWTREEGAPTIHQLGDPVLNTPNSRVFDFTTGQTVLVNAITGGNRNLQADRRNVWKLGANWQPWQNTDFRLRADYVHSTIERPISSISVTPAIEAAFPGRFVRCTIVDPLTGCGSVGQLQSVNLTPVNFEEARKDTLRFGFDFTKPLKSRRPSQAVIDQFRAQFFGSRGQGGGQGGSQGGTGSAGASPAGPPEGGGGGGRGFGGRGGGLGGGGFGGPGGQNRGRIQFSLTDTITFEDKVRIAPGGPELNYLKGDAAGSTGGTPRHNVQSQLGYFNNGLGARLGANWRSGTTVTTLTGDDLRFSPVGTFDLKLFANPGDNPEIAVKHAWLRGTQVRFEVNNIFNSRPRVRDAAGNVPLNYQPDLLDPLGRTIMISFRKLFLPSPSTIRRMFQEDRQGQAPSTR